jgi:hypothetical protein
MQEIWQRQEIRQGRAIRLLQAVGQTRRPQQGR